MAEEISPRHRPCRVLLLDTRTGGTARDADHWPDTPSFEGFSPYWWSEGNGGCDCNREKPFGHDKGDTGACLGQKRYLVISCSAPWATFREMNEGYPEALLAEFASCWRPWGTPETLSGLATTEVVLESEQRVVVGTGEGRIVLAVLNVAPGRVRLGIEAAPDVPVRWEGKK